MQSLFSNVGIGELNIYLVIRRVALSFSFNFETLQDLIIALPKVKIIDSWTNFHVIFRLNLNSFTYGLNQFYDNILLETAKANNFYL